MPAWSYLPALALAGKGVSIGLPMLKLMLLFRWSAAELTAGPGGA
jgi:hypothetical protein